MKILFVDLQYDYGMKDRGINEIGAKGFLKTFQSLGHEVIPFYYDDYLNNTPQLQEDLLKKADQFRPDLVYFHLFEEQFWPETLKKLKEKYKTINWFGDDHWRFESFTRQMAPLFSYSVTTDPFAVKKYQEMGLKVFLSQWAAIPDYRQDINNEYKYDVSFVGGSHSVRRWFVSELKKKNISVACFGYGWPSGPVKMNQIVELFQTSKINLNLSNSINYDLRYLTHNLKNPIVALTSKKSASQIKARNFEIPYYGGFQLTDYVPGLEKFFRMGEELVCYGNVDEAALLIHHFLQSETEREQIKQAGIKRSRAEHSYLERHKSYLEKIS